MSKKNTKNAIVKAVANSKGGTGKSITTISLSTAYSINNKVLIIDADYQRNTSHYFLNKNQVEKKNLFTAITKKTDLRKSIYKINENLDILASSIVLEKLNDIFKTKKAKYSFFKKLVDELRCDYDFIIFDTHPAVDNILINSLNAADMIIVPLEPDNFCFETIKTFTDFLKAFKIDKSFRILPVKIQVNLLNTMDKFQKNAIKELSKTYHKNMLNNNVIYSKKLNENLSNKSISKDKIFRNYMKISEEIHEQCKSN